MAQHQDYKKPAFELSMLVYDTRYRSTSFQVIALIIFFTFVWWLINNTMSNLAISGKDIDFAFLVNESNYDINQKLLEYDSRSTHGRAAILGVLNTLVLSVMGCITATILGVFVGISRLSTNWIIARIMTIYIEMFRNVPLLLWILLIMSMVAHSFPRPKSFKGADPSATLKLFDSVALTNRGFYIPEPLFSNGFGDLGFFSNSFYISLDLMAILAILGVSIWAAGKVKKRAKSIQEETGVRPTTWYIRLALIFIPTILLLFVLGFYLGYPELKGFNFKGGIHLRNSLIALWIALSLYTSAFIAEIVRSGILAVSKGQTEAASSLGIKPNIIMALVVLPQALRVIVPPLISNYLNLTKNSSLAIAVGYMDLTGTLMGITLNQTGRELETLLLGMSIYLCISLMISAVINWYNRRNDMVER
jgi:general L-amino acid transport system permease protein